MLVEPLASEDESEEDEAREDDGEEDEEEDEELLEDSSAELEESSELELVVSDCVEDSSWVEEVDVLVGSEEEVSSSLLEVEVSELVVTGSAVDEVVSGIWLVASSTVVSGDSWPVLVAPVSPEDMSLTGMSTEADLLQKRKGKTHPHHSVNCCCRSQRPENCQSHWYRRLHRHQSSLEW